MEVYWYVEAANGLYGVNALVLHNAIKGIFSHTDV